ncbi:MAG TPA: LptA/OstA family protein, partial [Candidatus Omnitrophota bacterium]|nr:LptA/OstA family protein [Candidatus Omnitrophota bacterium]
MNKRSVSFKGIVCKKLAAVSAFLSFSLALMPVQNSFAQDPSVLASKMKKDTPVVVDGDKVEYFDKENKITADGNVVVTYGDVTLKCDRIEVYTKAQQAACYGHVKIEHPDGVLTGDHIIYDLKNRKGELAGADVKAFPWFGQADETRRVSETEYEMKNGYITTCDLDEPHYRIKAKEIKVFPDDKIIAKDTIIYIGDTPVMWLPYYYHPIVQSRSKVQFIPGYSSDWGYFLLSSWRFYIKGNTKVDVLLDYRTKKGFAEGANFYYFADDLGLEGLGSGIFRGYYVEQNGWGTYDKTAFRDEEGTDPKLRNRFQWQHRVDFDENTLGLIGMNKISDKYVLKDYFYNEYEENSQDAQNYVYFTTGQENFIASVQATPRINDFYTQVQKLPEAEIVVPNQRLGETSFFYTSETSATYFDKEYEDGSSNPSERVARFDTCHRLSYVEKLGCMRVIPYGEFRETAYNRKRWQSEGAYDRQTFGGGLDTSTRFYNLYNVKTDFAGMDINGLRHIVMPGVEYFTRHQPTIGPDSLYQMDDVDAISKSNGMTFYLENKLQTKRHAKDGSLYTVDFIRYIFSTDYYFYMKKDECAFERKSALLDNMKMQGDFNPYEWLYLRSEMELVPNNQSVKTGIAEFTVTPPGKRFHATCGYRYEKKADDPRNQFTFDTSYILSPKWR